MRLFLKQFNPQSGPNKVTWGPYTPVPSYHVTICTLVMIPSHSPGSSCCLLCYMLNMTVFQTLTASMLLNMHAYTWGTPGKKQDCGDGCKLYELYSTHTPYIVPFCSEVTAEILLAARHYNGFSHPFTKYRTKGLKVRGGFLERR